MAKIMISECSAKNYFCPVPSHNKIVLIAHVGDINGPYCMRYIYIMEKHSLKTKNKDMCTLLHCIAYVSRKCLYLVNTFVEQLKKKDARKVSK